MAVELIRDLLKIDQVVGREEIQALIEGEITVPETKPKINKILKIDGDVQVTGTKVMKDKMIVSGIVDFKVLYNASDEIQSVHSINASTDFREEIEIESLDEKASAEVNAKVEHVDYGLAGDSKISVKTVLDIESKVFLDNNIDIVKDIKGTEGLQILKERIKYNDILGISTSSTLVKEAFELEESMPDIVDVLRVDVKVHERETKVVDDKVIVAGVVACSIMYFGDDEENKVNYLSHEIPFTHFVEIPGAVRDMDCKLKLKAGEVNYDIKEDINDDIRIIDIESTVEIEAKVYNQVEKEVTVDTYSPNKKIDIKKQEVMVTENIGQNIIEETINGKIDVSEDKEIIKAIYNINGRPLITDYRLIENKVIIEGILELDMLYLAEADNEIKDVKQEIPFKTCVEIEGVNDTMEVEVENILKDISYKQLNSHEVEVNTIVKNAVSVNRIKKINIVTEAVETDEIIDKNIRPSITIYIVQKDDTLWDIAKRYNTTVEELISSNDILTPENIMPGEKIIIENNITYEI